MREIVFGPVDGPPNPPIVKLGSVPVGQKVGVLTADWMVGEATRDDPRHDLAAGEVYLYKVVLETCTKTPTGRVTESGREWPGGEDFDVILLSENSSQDTVER